MSPTKSRGFFLPGPSSNGSLPVPWGDMIFCCSEWLRPFLLLMREEPGQEAASSPAFPTVAADLSCMPPNQGSSLELQHPPLPADLSHEYLVEVLERACECMQTPLVS